MTDSPDERRFSEQEFALILRRATELGRERPAAGSRQMGLTLPDMQEIAREVGIDPELVARAAEVLPEVRLSLAARIFGGPEKYRVVQAVPGKIPQEDLGRLLEAIRGVLDHQGQAEEAFGGLEWKSVGNPTMVSVNVSTRKGETRLEVGVDRGGAGLLSYFFPVVPTAIITGVLGASLGVETLPGILALVVGGIGAAGSIGRAIFARGTRKWNDTIPRLMDALSATVRDTATPAEDPTTSDE